jgi:hypothetical protein
LVLLAIVVNVSSTEPVIHRGESVMLAAAAPVFRLPGGVRFDRNPGDVSAHDGSGSLLRDP